jgi:hypothetical protein
MPAESPKPGAGTAQSFLFVARIGSMVGGGSARSCAFYLGKSGLLQMDDEETDGTLHALSEGQGGAGSLLEEGAKAQPAPAGSPAAKARPPLSEYYGAKIAVTSLSAGGRYRADSYEAAAAPAQITDLVQRVEAEVHARHLPAAPAGLYARARRVVHFVPEIEPLHATVSPGQLGSLPKLAELITKEMSLVRLGLPGEPGALAKDLSIRPGRAVRVKVGDLVYLLQAYDYRGPQSGTAEPCANPSPPQR